MTKHATPNYVHPARMVSMFTAAVTRIEDFVEVFNGFDFDGVGDVEVETSLEINVDGLTEGADEDVGYGALIEKIGEVLGVEVSNEQEDTLRDLLSSVAYDVASVIKGRLEGLEIEKSRGGFVVAKATASSVAEGLSGALEATLDAARKEALVVQRNAIRVHNERVREANAKVLPLPAPAPQPAPVAAPVPAPQPEPKAKARKPKAKADPAPAAPAAPVAAPAAPVAAPAASATLPADLAALVAAIRSAPTEMKAVQLAYPKAFALTMALDIYVAGDDMKKARAIVAALRG